MNDSEFSFITRHLPLFLKNNCILMLLLRFVCICMPAYR